MEISTGLILSMMFAAAVSIGTPIAYMVYCKKVLKASLVPIVGGITVYLVAAAGLESIMHQFLLYGNNAVSAFINSNKWVYVIYIGIAAALFEELGRWFAFKFMLKKYLPNDTALTYGIGHGGIQSIIPVGIGLAVSAVMLFMVKSTGYEEYLAMIGEDQAEVFNEMILSYTSTGMHYYLWTALEGVVTLAAQVGLSVLVFKAVRTDNSKYLLLAAVGLHILFTSFGALYSSGIIKNIAVIEIGCLIIGAAIALFAFYEYRKLKKE